jgi:ribosomal-protein-alanine N-acetyltransferase
MFPDTFHTARLTLRPIAPDDAVPIFNTYAQDQEVTRFLTWKPHRHISDTQAYIAQCAASPPDAARTYVLVPRAAATHATPILDAPILDAPILGAPILGAIDLRLADRHRVGFGYVLARPHWGKGYMTEALREVVTWALAQPRIFRIGSVCDTENAGSRRVMEKAGLTQDGLLRRWLVHPNISERPRDCFSYANVR